MCACAGRVGVGGVRLGLIWWAVAGDCCGDEYSVGVRNSVGTQSGVDFG